jgi:hypothetical protein
MLETIATGIKEQIDLEVELGAYQVDASDPRASQIEAFNRGAKALRQTSSDLT